MSGWVRVAAHHDNVRLFLRLMHSSSQPTFIPTITSTIEFSTHIFNPNENPCVNDLDVITLCREGRLKEALECLDLMNQRGIKVDTNTYASLLQACTNANALVEAKKVHAHMLANKFELNVYLGNKLVSMYAKCGSLVDACLAFDNILNRNVISWNAMIRGFAMHGHWEEVLRLYYKMQGVGIQADKFTFPSVLKACAGLSALELGKEIHDYLARCGCQSDVGVANALVNMYAKCGSGEAARQVFDNISQRDVVSWNVMIAGYSQNGQGRQAIDLYRQMQLAGEKPNYVTIACVVPICAALEGIELGRNIHNYTIKSGLEIQLVVGNALVTMYARCSRMVDARQVFDRMLQRDAVSWNAMIAGYSQNGHCDQALRVFGQMVIAGVKPNSVTIASVLPVCAHSADIQQGKEIHGYAIRSGFQLDVSVGNALIAMYPKCGSIEYARQVFDKMSHRDVVSWNAIIAAYAQDGCFDEALEWFRQMQLKGIKPDSVTIVTVLPACAYLEDLQQGKGIHDYIIRSGAFEFDVTVGNALVTFYSKSGNIENACQVFNKMSERDVVSWNAMLAGYAQNGHCKEALNLFYQMQMACLKSDAVTISIVLPACAHLLALKQGKEIHDFVIRNNLVEDVVVGNALVDMYAKCGRIEDARQVFDKMSNRNVVSGNAMIAGYAKCGNKEDALDLFDKMSVKDVASWNVMMAVYGQNGHGNEALKLFCEMLLTDMKPDSVTIASVLSACAHLAALQLGKEIHDYIIRRGLDSDVFVKSGLVDMYAKCGSLENACQVFEKMSQRDVVTWTAMISGYAMHGHGEDALTIFYQMQQAGLQPDHVTFTAVLSACSHAGLVDDGRRYFDCMIGHYCITPSAEHYACMVDLLGRAGHLIEAYYFIEKMPLEPNANVWGALLGACRIHCNTELGELAAEQLFELESSNTGNYILLSNIYAAAGRWDGVQYVRKMMKDRGLKKMPGCSWIEVKNRVHAFFVEELCLSDGGRVCSSQGLLLNNLEKKSTFCVNSK
eukprot:Gb_15666 [translate_table: standard]